MKFERWHTANSSFYSLLDFGDGEKLEQFGEVILIRPEPLARNKCRWSRDEWLGKAHARFEQTGSTTGNWISLKKHPLEWDVTYKLRDAHFRFRLKLTKFKHVGVFPEQGSYWNFIFDKVQETSEAKVLNLFAYTGGASLAARVAGAQTFHVDSIKQVISWSRENQELSNLDNIHWVVEDALKFLAREAKRGRKYTGIIMDPPAWGRGPKGERWKLESKLDELLSTAAEVLDHRGFAVINTYSGLHLDKLKDLTGKYFPNYHRDSKKLSLKSASGLWIDTGCVCRIQG